MKNNQSPKYNDQTIEDFIDIKIKALAQYKDEMRGWV